jgi:hypothetical protein
LVFQNNCRKYSTDNSVNLWTLCVLHTVHIVHSSSLLTRTIFKYKYFEQLYIYIYIYFLTVANLHSRTHVPYTLLWACGWLLASICINLSVTIYFSDADLSDSNKDTLPPNTTVAFRATWLCVVSVVIRLQAASYPSRRQPRTALRLTSPIFSGYRRLFPEGQSGRNVMSNTPI